MTTDYAALKLKIEDWLMHHQVLMSIKLIGDACPMFCEDKGKPGIGAFPRKTHIHGQHYQLTLTRAGKLMIVDFWNSYRDAELTAIGTKAYQLHQSYMKFGKEGKPKVTVADVLSCCEFYDHDSFDDFADEFGYDKDSRKAEEVYKAVQNQVRDFKRMFTSEELGELSDMVREL